MAMLPVFVFGIVVGVVVTNTYHMYKKETPSETQFRMLTKELEQERNDKKMLDKLVDKLYAKIDKLEKELNKVK